ncbi:hypothetical protein [Arthrobacter sp. AG258]|nr:hypothetical protein [Arthrobacter sp. AG258]
MNFPPSLVPVFREANSISKVLSNVGRLGQPRSKLGVLMLQG